MGYLDGPQPESSLWMSENPASENILQNYLKIK
jgi:hypothetical protein